MALAKQAILSDLDRQLAGFLKSYAIKRLERFEAADRVNRLKQVTFGKDKQFSNLDRRFKALETWFIEVGPRLPKKSLNKEMISDIANCVEKIGLYCCGRFDFDDKQALLFDRKRAARVASMASVFLHKAGAASGHKYMSTGLRIARPTEHVRGQVQEKPSGETDIKDKFIDSLNYQCEMIEYFQRPDDHLFTVTDYLLNKLEEKPDIQANHMTASILYFMKLHGYKVAPYVERLQKLKGRSHDR